MRALQKFSVSVSPFPSLSVLVQIVGLLALATVTLAGCGSEEQALNLTPDAQAGKAFADSNCMGCHTTSGAQSSGPTWKELPGSQVELADGRTITADDAYLLRAVQEPGADVVKGFRDSMSSAFPAGSISDEQAKQLVAYLNALK